MTKHEAMTVLAEMRDQLQHTYKLNQQQVCDNLAQPGGALTLIRLSKQISALTLAMNYLEHYGSTP